MEHLVALAWAGEEALLTPRVRSSAPLLEELLAPDFTEIGQSGRRWTRAEIIAALVDDTSPAPTATVSDREIRTLSEDTVLLTYRLDFEGRQSWRTSLWRQVDGTAQCFYHQGTTVPRSSAGAGPSQ
jgi:hypothetical protein